MKVGKKDLLLYAVTDRSWLGERPLEEQVEAALEGGITFLQLREKALDENAFIKSAESIKKLTDQYKIPLIINDNVAVALAVNADGVHIGQRDMVVSQARSLLGTDKILGVSARTVEQAIEAEAMGADYLGVGSAFGTLTKQDAIPVSYETIKAIAEAVSIPVVAIGGITKENMKALKGSGIAGVAVVSAVFAQENINEATKLLKETIREVIE